MSNSTFFVVTNVLCVIIGVLIGLALDDVLAGKSVLRDWQALIAGALAVAAAYATITQMQLSDTAQEARHRQLVGLNLREDALLVNSACIPLAKQLIDWADETQRRMEKIEELSKGEDAADWPSWEDVDAYDSKARQIAHLAESSQLRNIEHLLSPSMIEIADRLRASAGTFSDRMTNFLQVRHKAARISEKRKMLDERPGTWLGGVRGETGPLVSYDLQKIRSILAHTPRMTTDARNLGVQLQSLLSQYQTHADISEILGK